LADKKQAKLMTQKPSVNLTDGGLWNTRRPQHSTETTRLLKSNTQ